MKRVAYLALASLLVAVAPSRSEAQESRSAVNKRLKAATVRIDVQIGGKTIASGSGLLVARYRVGGHLVTTGDVLVLARQRGAAIRVAFEPGTPRRQFVAGRVVGPSVEGNLLLLSVRSHSLPEAYPLSPNTLLKKALGVTVVGHEGDKEPQGVRSRKATVGKRALVGAHSAVFELAGPLVRGMSGGPVATDSGEVVGLVTVGAGSKGSSLVTSARTIVTLMQGRVVNLRVEQTDSEENRTLKIRAELFDPCRKVRRVEIRVLPAEGPPPAGTDPLDAEPLLLRLLEGAMSGELLVPKSSTYLIQTCLVFEEGDPRFSTATVVEPEIWGSVGRVQPLSFPGVVEGVLPDPIGQGLLLLMRDPRKPGSPPRLWTWDLAQASLGKEIKLPISPQDVSILEDGRIVACCTESGVVAVVDPNTRKIVRAVEVEGSRDGRVLLPRKLASQPPQGKVVVLCGEKGDLSPQVAEIDLETGKVVYHRELPTQSLTFSGQHAVIQRNFQRYPSGVPYLFKSAFALSKEPHVPQGKLESLKAPWSTELSAGPAIPIKGGFALSSDEKTSAYLIGKDKPTWEQPGVVLARYPNRPVLCLSRTPLDLGSTKRLPLVGVDLNEGTVLWERTLHLPHSISPQIERAALLGRLPNVVLNSEFDVKKWAKVMSPRSINPGVVVTQAGRDWVVFSISEWQPVEALGDRAVRLRELRRSWWASALPPLKGAGDVDPPARAAPTSIQVGDELAFRIAAKPKPGETFVIVRAPTGLKVDAKSGVVTWSPDATSLGRHNIEIALEKDGSRRKVLKTVLRVRLP
ncbi:MAG: trypsin-like peptidase domain-containing protein [Planctomycetes bacterium]|nr:trypsin-like peptidase domain-containing protein [Planctomycetota bacterium]